MFYTSLTGMVTREGHPVEDSHTVPHASGPEFVLKGKSAEATCFAQEYLSQGFKITFSGFRCEHLVRSFLSGDGGESDGTVKFGI